MSEAIEPFRDPRRRRGPRRPARPAGADTLPRPDRRHRLGVRDPDRLPARARRSTGATTYDWRAQEARLNELAHFRTTIDGQSIHFVHARSPHADAFPLLLTHGWPGSVVEFLDVIPADARRGAPTLPRGRAVAARATASRSRPRTRGWDAARIARAFIALMDRLGYARYGAQGGDWGAQVATRIGALDPEHCAAIHLNMPIARSARRTRSQLTDADQADLAAFAAVPARGVGLRARAGDEAADARRRRSTTRPPACSRGSSRSSARGATATAIPRTRSPATSCSRT